MVPLDLVGSFRIWKSKLFWYNVNCPGPRLNETQQDWNLGLEYNKYLQEVVSILESDPDFRKKLENAKVWYQQVFSFLLANIPYVLPLLFKLS
jgi:hypothetical protein